MVERLTYPFPTPSAARGILSAVYSKPKEFFYQINRIEILNPISYVSFKCNEVKSRVSSNPIDVEEDRTQRMTVALRDVDFNNILESVALKSWWAEYRKQFLGGGKEQLERCLITGDLTTPLRTAGVVTGLHAVGGHARGDAVICFDKAAFESYDLKQAVNAPVSEEAMSAVNTALTELLNHDVTISFLDQFGNFEGRLCGKVSGNVLLRKRQYDQLRDQHMMNIRIMNSCKIQAEEIICQDLIFH